MAQVCAWGRLYTRGRRCVHGVACTREGTGVPEGDQLAAAAGRARRGSPVGGSYPSRTGSAQGMMGGLMGTGFGGPPMYGAGGLDPASMLAGGYDFGECARAAPRPCANTSRVHACARVCCVACGCVRVV